MITFRCAPRRGGKDGGAGGTGERTAVHEDAADETQPEGGDDEDREHDDVGEQRTRRAAVRGGYDRRGEREEDAPDHQCERERAETGRDEGHENRDQRDGQEGEGDQRDRAERGGGTRVAVDEEGAPAEGVCNEPADSRSRPVERGEAGIESDRVGLDEPPQELRVVRHQASVFARPSGAERVSQQFSGSHEDSRASGRNRSSQG